MTNSKYWYYYHSVKTFWMSVYFTHWLYLSLSLLIQIKYLIKELKSSILKSDQRKNFVELKYGKITPNIKASHMFLILHIFYQ